MPVVVLANTKAGVFHQSTFGDGSGDEVFVVVNQRFHWVVDTRNVAKISDQQADFWTEHLRGFLQDGEEKGATGLKELVWPPTLRRGRREGGG